MPTNPLSLGFDLPFNEAIAQAVKRGVVLPDIYYGKLQGLARQQAFSIAGITSLDTLQAVKESLDKVITEGGTFGAWKTQMLESGTLNLPLHRLDNIYRTNLQGSYMAARWDRFLVTQSTRPYIMYDAINDSRVRPTHLALDGIIRRLDDPFWRTHSAPNGYRCRCNMRSLSEDQAKARSGFDSEGNGKGLNKQPVYKDINGVGHPADPDKGWDYNPSNRLAGVNRAIEDKRGKSSDVLFSALSDKLSQTMQIITLEGFGVVQTTMQKIANDKPEWFPLGFNGIYAVSNQDMFAGFDVENSKIYISISDELVSGFSPANELMESLARIKSKNQLTFNNEYAVESVWHEIIRGITKIRPTRYPDNAEPIEEGLVQYMARHSYHYLLNAFGAAPLHQDKIIANGLAYPVVTSNLLYFIDRADVNSDKLFEILKASNWNAQLKQHISEKLSISSKKIGYLFNLAETKPILDFKAKVDVQIKNAQHNTGAS